MDADKWSKCLGYQRNFIFGQILIHRDCAYLPARVVCDTKVNFLSRVEQVLIQSFPCPRPSLTNPVSPTIYPIAEGRIFGFILSPKVLALWEMQAASCPFSSAIFITQQAPHSQIMCLESNEADLLNLENNVFFKFVTLVKNHLINICSLMIIHIKQKLLVPPVPFTRNKTDIYKPALTC